MYKIKNKDLIIDNKAKDNISKMTFFWLLFYLYIIKY